MRTIIKVQKSDITKLEVEAIVNAANTTLLGGGGVDGAIHRAAGPELLKECRKIGGCPTGEARITKGYLLPAKYVIHTVGPIWFGGTNNEDELLKKCYQNSLQLAVKTKIHSLAFPAISTGAYRFPIEKAATIVSGVMEEFIPNNFTIEKILFSCFSDSIYETFKQALKKFL